jgi:hypothetical protein
MSSRSCHSRQLATLFFVLALGWVLPSCGPSETVTTAKNLRATIYHRTCELLITCNLPLSSVFDLYGEGIDGCAKLLARAGSGSVNDLVAKVERGAVTFDGVAFDTCWANALKTCSPSTTAVCMEAFDGQGGIGAGCNTEVDCSGDAYCDNDSGFACPGTCAALKSPGTGCTSDDECAPGDGFAECANDPISQTSVCVQRAPKTVAEGERCGSNVDGFAATCGKGLWCKADPARPLEDIGLCAVPLALGTECSGNDVCVRGASCSELGAGSRQECTKFKVSHKAGVACDGATRTVCAPLDGLACINGACIAVGGELGATCGASFVSTCKDGLTCIADKCAAPVATGQPCRGNQECASGSCDALTERCRADFCD